MPIEIPDVAKLQRASPSGQARVATIDTRGAGAGLATVGRAFGDYAERRTKVDIAEARADFLTKKAELDGSMDEDTDYSTLTNRYTTALEQTANDAAARISDPAAREMFIQNIRPTLEQSHQQVKNVAWNKEKAAKLDEFTRRSQQLREAGLKGDLVSATGAQEELINSYVDAGYIPVEKRSQLLQAARVDMATGKLRMMDPRDRMEALKQPWAQNLPSDTRAQLMRESEAAARIEKAQTAVDGYFARHLSPAEARAQIAKDFKNDPEGRAAAESRFDYMNAAYQRDEVQVRSDLKDKWFDDVASGQTTWQAIMKDHPDEWDAMGADVQSTLMSAQRQSVSSTKVPFNLAVHDHLTQLKASLDRGVPGAALAIRKYFIAHAAEMSTEQQKTWSDISIDGVMGPRATTGLSDVQAIAARLPETADANKRRQLLGYMGEWRSRFIEQNGRNPTDEDRKKAIDRALIEYSTGFWSSKPVYQMTPEEATAAKQELKDEHPQESQKAAEYWARKGVQPTDAQFMETVTKIQQLPSTTVPAAVQQPASPPPSVVSMPAAEEVAPPAAPRTNLTSADFNDMSQEEIAVTLARYEDQNADLYNQITSEYGGSPTPYQIMAEFEQRTKTGAYFMTEEEIKKADPVGYEKTKRFFRLNRNIEKTPEEFARRYRELTNASE